MIYDILATASIGLFMRIAYIIAPQCDIILKIYHSFVKRISLKKHLLAQVLFTFYFSTPAAFFAKISEIDS